MAYADDIVFFIENVRDIEFIRRVFERWKSESGLLVNDAKTKLLWTVDSELFRDERWENVLVSHI